MKKKYTYLIVIFLLVATFITYGRILGNEFIGFDDNRYIIENNNIKSGINPESVKWAFTAVVFSNWHPLTWLSHMLDWCLFKDHAGGHHLISLLLHIGVALFLFFFLSRMTNNLWSSAFVAALIALHPLRVESVAWAAERKDVLSMFFGLAALYAYTLYTEKFQFSKYCLCLIFFALSLMAKPMLVTLPFVLLLLDFWPLERWPKEMFVSIKKCSHLIGGLLWEKAPFIFLTIVSSIVTIWAQNKGGSFASMKYLPFSSRVANAIISYVSYLGKIFSPVDLAVFYPYEHSFPLWQILVSCFILIGITIVVIYAIKKFPFLFVGWFWYLGTLIPVIGLVQVGEQAMADRYTYLPSIGIAIMLVWGVPLLFQNETMRRKILFPAGIFYLTILAVLTWQQCGYWKNNITLFSHALQVTNNNYLAHNNLASALVEKGEIEEAIHHYNETISIMPAHILNSKGHFIYNNRGNAYTLLGQNQQAIEDYNRAILLKPDFADPYNNRGSVYFNQGNNKRGCGDAQKACELGNCITLDAAKGRGYCR